MNFPPVTLGFPAWILGRLRRVPITFEIQDMWPETLRATGMVKNETALGIVDWLARWGYRRAAAIRVISPGFRDNLLSKERVRREDSRNLKLGRYRCYRPREPSTELADEFGLKTVST